MSTCHIIAGGGNSEATEIPKIMLELPIKYAAKFRGAPLWKQILLNTWIKLEALRIYHSRLRSV